MSAPVRSRARGSRRGGAGHGLRLRLRIDGLALGGEGIARIELDGRQRTVFVPMSAPGDELEVELRPEGATPRARILRILAPSPDRVAAPCSVADRCGGCDWMHLSIEAQRRHREALVREALSHASPELGSAPIHTHLAASTERYRTRIRLGVWAQQGRVVVGYRAMRSHDLVHAESCLVASPPLDEARLQAPGWLQGSHGTGELAIAAGAAGRPALSLRWSGELASGVFAQAATLVERGRWAGVELLLEGATQPAIIGDPSGIVAGADGAPLRTAAGGFLQAHDQISRELARCVADRVIQGQRTLELFCGAGNLTVMIAARTERLVAVEGEPAAVQAAKANLAARGLRARVTVADANALEVASDVRVVVLDPPRTGAAGACKRIAASRARRVVMVSCDPPTLSRDLVLLAPPRGRWRPVSVDLFEMFPHTSHAETLVVLEREAGS